MISMLQGKRQLRHTLASSLAWRTQVRWYALSVAFPCSVFAASALIVVILFPTRIIWPSTAVLFGSAMTLPFGPVWEEIAWRAFALRKLEQRYSQTVSAAVLGLYWAVWHIPLWYVTLTYLTMPLLLVICANLVAWSFIFAFLYNRSGESLPVVILLHATYVAVQNVVFASLSHGGIHLIPVSMVISACVAFGIARKWGRTQRGTAIS